MAEQTGKAYQPRIVRGRIEIWTPHSNGEIAFASPAVGPANYINTGKQILDSNQQVPTGDYTSSLLHSAYCSDAKNEPEFGNVRDLMRTNWLWIFNRNLWTENWVYVLQDTNATGRSQQLDEKDLEKMLKGGKDIFGISFSKDGKLRFAPKGNYVLGNHTPESLAKDGFIIASNGLEGAEKLGEVSAKFRNTPFVYGVEVQEGKASEQRVSAVDEDGGRLGFYGYNWSGNYDCHAFGVWK